MNENSDKAKLYKLYTKAMKLMPGSPAQKKIKKEIDKLRKKLGITESMKTFHIDEPNEIGKKKQRIKKDDVLLVKQAMEERKYNTIFKKIMNESEDDTIHSVGILLFYKGRMLIAQRTSGKWSIPKGRIKQNENPVDAIQREVIEELGFQLPKIPRKVKILDKENGGQFHIFAVVLDRPETMFLNDEHTVVEWIKIESNIILPVGFDEDLEQVIQDMFGLKK